MSHLRNFFLVGTSVLILVMITMVVSAQTSAETAKQNVKTHSEYALPYPGILPGNPLYEVKMLRDRAFEMLIVDPVKKADFYLLQADKRLSAGMFLLKKGNNQLGEETISKGEKYFALSVDLAWKAKNKGKVTKDLTDRLARSWDKHEEVLSDISQNGDPKIVSGINSSYKLLTDTKVKMLKHFNSSTYSLPFPTFAPDLDK